MSSAFSAFAVQPHIIRPTCTQLQSGPSGFADLKAKPALAQVQAGRALPLTEVKGQQQPRLVPGPELQRDRNGPRRPRRPSGQLEEAAGVSECHGDRNRLRASKGHVALKKRKGGKGERNIYDLKKKNGDKEMIKHEYS